MNQRKQKQEGSGMEEQRVILENRNKMTVSQGVDVDAFDEETLWANLADGAVEVSGSGLHIEKLDLAEGVLVVTGSISSFAYIEGKKQKGSKRLKALAGRLRND